MPLNLALDRSYPSDWEVGHPNYIRCTTFDECKDYFMRFEVDQFSISSCVCSDTEEWKRFFRWLILQCHKNVIMPPLYWRVYFGKESFRTMVREYMFEAHEHYYAGLVSKAYERKQHSEPVDAE
jgi:hypothetical protein